MKSLCLLVIAITAVFVHATSNQAEYDYPIVSTTNSFDGKTWICDVKEEAFHKAPTWNPEASDIPPLAPGAALRVAEAYAKNLIDTASPEKRKISAMAEHVSLCIAGIGENIWYYNVKFQVGRGGFFVDRLNVIVTMDGKVPAWTLGDKK